mgnify:CR=1 FL=1
MNRIIPAHAGFTADGIIFQSRAWDHPRSRGVYSMKLFPRLSRSGSSPLTRGLPPRGWREGGGGGIIPAHAGFTRA